MHDSHPSGRIRASTNQKLCGLYHVLVRIGQNQEDCNNGSSRTGERLYSIVTSVYSTRRRDQMRSAYGSNEVPRNRRLRAI